MVRVEAGCKHSRNADNTGAGQAADVVVAILVEANSRTGQGKCGSGAGESSAKRVTTAARCEPCACCSGGDCVGRQSSACTATRRAYR